MADGQPKSSGGKQTPYPANWGRMTAGQKREWAAKNRPAQPAAPRPAQPTKPPQAPPVAAEVPTDEPTGDQPAEGQEEPQEGYEEECTDTVQVSIKIPGQDVTTLGGKELVALILRALADSVSG